MRRTVEHLKIMRGQCLNKLISVPVKLLATTVATVRLSASFVYIKASDRSIYQTGAPRCGSGGVGRGGVVGWGVGRKLV